MTWEWRTPEQLVDILRERSGEIRHRAFTLRNERADTFRGLFVTMANLLSSASNELSTALHDATRLREQMAQQNDAYQLQLSRRIDEDNRWNERLRLRDDKIIEYEDEREKFKEQISLLWLRVRKLEAADLLQRTAVGAGGRNYFED